MRLDDERESDNVEDVRGQGGGFGGGGFGFGGGGGGFGGGGMLPMLFGFVLSRFGCGGVVVLFIVLALFGGLGNLGAMLGGGGQVGQPQAGRSFGPNSDGGTPAAPGQEDSDKRFVRKVLASTEDTWTRLLPEQANVRYVDPKRVLFSGSTQSGCGGANAATGPFYCPADKKVYLDASFFNELSQRFGAPGQFADAYVIAHEIGHHVQDLLGISDKAQGAMDRASPRQRNAISVRLELQADCLAGVWAAANPQLLDPGDVDQAVRAATAIGDDRLQQAAQGTVVPDSFTHGSSAQRVHWLQTGLQAGRIDACDTFSGGV
ncbi:MAG: zinc metallopeptidase [Sphingomonadaceae bacterium]|nr:zinc metallopeptidase [Sphingomonadaceae bacterium]